MSDEDLRVLIERLRTAAADGLAAQREPDASRSQAAPLDARLANEAAMAVNELLAIRAILRVSTRSSRCGAEPLH